MKTTGLEEFITRNSDRELTDIQKKIKEDIKTSL